jgi:hypothetical protein
VATFTEPKYIQLKTRLNALPKKKLAIEELETEASKVGLTHEEMVAFVDHLHKTGSAFHVQVGSANFVFLDTKIITHTLSDLLDPTGRTVRLLVAEKTEKLRVLSIIFFLFV